MDGRLAVKHVSYGSTSTDSKTESVVPSDDLSPQIVRQKNKNELENWQLRLQVFNRTVSAVSVPVIALGGSHSYVDYSFLSVSIMTTNYVAAKIQDKRYNKESVVNYLNEVGSYHLDQGMAKLVTMFMLTNAISAGVNVGLYAGLKILQPVVVNTINYKILFDSNALITPTLGLPTLVIHQGMWNKLASNYETNLLTKPYEDSKKAAIIRAVSASGKAMNFLLATKVISNNVPYMSNIVNSLLFIAIVDYLLNVSNYFASVPNQ